MIVCSEPSIVRSDVYFFVKDSTILLQWSVASLFQYKFVETFTAKVRFNGSDVLATVCRTTQTQQLLTSELSFEEARLSLIMLFVFYTTCSGEQVCYSISSETLDTVI